MLNLQSYVNIFIFEYIYYNWTAGVYLLMRCSPLLEQSSLALLIITVTGAVTSFFAASIGLFQNDIKKIIAYSTMSQLAREYNNIIIFRYRTVCVELIFFNVCNSQITKAHSYIIYNYISSNFFNSFSALRQYFIICIYIIMSVKWKIITLSKLVGISEAIRLVLIIYYFNNKIDNKYNYYYYLINIYFFFINNYLLSKFNILKFNYVLNKLLIKNDSNFNSSNNSKCKSEDYFFEWLAGIIDGDGYFHLSKKGSARFQITMDIRDKKALYEIKQKLGGSIHSIANANALRYQLSHKKGLIILINGVNGLIRNPIRMLQMNKLCVKYRIEIKYPKPLTYYNGWFSGFIDSDGSIYLNEKSGQVFISVSQKNKYLLEPLINLYGGKIYISSPKIEAFKYSIYKKNELFDLINDYFSKYLLKTKKLGRLILIKEFYLTRINKNNQDIIKLNNWVLFKDKWDKYND